MSGGALLAEVRYLPDRRAWQLADRDGRTVAPDHFDRIVLDAPTWRGPHVLAGRLVRASIREGAYVLDLRYDGLLAELPAGRVERVGARPPASAARAWLESDGTVDALVPDAG